MTDKHELQHLPNHAENSILTTEVSNALISRGRKDASLLLVSRREPTYLARVRVKKQWGLIDKNGKYVVDNIYGDIQEFSSGLAAFSASPTDRHSYTEPIENLFSSDLGLWGYLNDAGAVAINPTFERARSFREGLAGVALGGKWGFIRKDGGFAIVPKFEGVSDFKEGFALIRFKKKCGFINKFGEISIEPRFDLAREFSEGLSSVTVDGRCGFIDEVGTFVIPPLFDATSDFRNGIARVEKDDRQSLIERDGNIIFQCAENGESIGEFVDGIARVTEPGGYWDHGYFINMSGDRILDSETEHADTLDAVEDFSEGMGLVGVSVTEFDAGRFSRYRYADRKGSVRAYGYIDTRGKMIIEPQFYSATPFKSGMAVVDPTGDEKYGFTDRSGNVIISARFISATNFSNGLARVIDLVEGKEKWGFIDQAGAIVIPFQFDRRDYVEDFQSIE